MREEREHRGHGEPASLSLQRLDGVYQKDLGPNAAVVARRMTAFDPDSTWKPVE